MQRRRRWATVMVGMAATAGAASAPAGAAQFFVAAGDSPAAIQAEVDAFRTALGTLNANTPGTRFSGRREINWDGVPDQFAAPNLLPPDFFNVNSPRGVVFTGADGFQVSANSDNPTATPVEFGNLDPGYPGEFQTFSPQRLFTSLGTNVYDVEFRQPGEEVPAVSRGFGAVFTDVDLADTSSLTFRGDRGFEFGTLPVPAAPGGLSFVGVIHEPGEGGLGSVRVTQGNVAPGTPDGGSDDAVVVDDFIYGEPTIDCGGEVPTAVGTPGDDVLNGTDGIDVLAGLAGRDRISGRGDDDFVCGGPGRDTVSGGPGNDFVDGADETTAFRYFEFGEVTDGPDHVRGDGGNDVVLGFNGDDTVTGGDGHDLMNGETGSDRHHGQDGDDVIVAGGDVDDPGDDLLRGDAGTDFLLDNVGDDAGFGGPGQDFIFLGAGDDFASGGSEFDILAGEFEIFDNLGNPFLLVNSGDDTFFGGLGDDFLDGGPGEDYLNGEQDDDTCLNGETVRNCEDEGVSAARRSAGARHQGLAQGLARGATFDVRAAAAVR